jgi:hypothetical protein
MATTPEESLAKMVAALKEKTGRSLEEWQAAIAAKGLEKHGEVVNFLKTEHGVSHGYANQIALRRKPEAPSTGDPIEEIFSGKPLAKEIYDAAMTKLKGFGGDLDLAPKKGYVSVRRNKQFAMMQPAANRLDIGFIMKGVDPTARLEPSGSWNAMFTHRVRVGSKAEVDDELVGWLRQAYDRS